jgi:hypothetical protein
MYYGISQTTLEEGSFDAAFDWINKSLMVSLFANEKLFKFPHCL